MEGRKKSYRRSQNQPGYLSDTVPQFCRDCAQYASCNLCHDEQLRERCPLLQEDIPLFYKNSEGYSDPTTYYALLNVERERKAKQKAVQIRQKDAKAQRSTLQNKSDEKESYQPHHRTQVLHY